MDSSRNRQVPSLSRARARSACGQVPVVLRGRCFLSAPCPVCLLADWVLTAGEGCHSALDHSPAELKENPPERLLLSRRSLQHAAV